MVIFDIFYFCKILFIWCNIYNIYLYIIMYISIYFVLYRFIYYILYLYLFLLCLCTLFVIMCYISKLSAFQFVGKGANNYVSN